ncbi:hypothetical protein HDU67_002914 [Dinochytrium kinnereticum]|nr:hypothetical protein HDU67_002914 [Dinochytrium kinnereticum]
MTSTQLRHSLVGSHLPTFGGSIHSFSGGAPKNYRSRAASESYPTKWKGDRYVPRGYSSSYLSIPLAEQPTAGLSARSSHPNRSHNRPKPSHGGSSRKSPVAERPADTPKISTKNLRTRRRSNSFYASRRRSAAALAKSLKEQQTMSPDSRLDLGRDRLWALMAEAGISPLASTPVTREELLNQEDPVGWSGSDEDYESEVDSPENCTHAAATPSSMSLNLDHDIDEAFADLGLDF